MSDDTKPKLIHSTKFMDGRVTPEEMHHHAVYGGKFCDVCKAPACHHAITFAPVSEIINKQGMEYLKWIASQNGGNVPMIKLKSGASSDGEKFVKIGTSYSCEGCFSEMQRALAKGPSWVLHEIDPGKPEASRPLVSVR